MNGFELFAAFGLDLWLGDPRRLPHPVVAIGRLINLLEVLLYDTSLSQRVAVIVFGVLLRNRGLVLL
jgi:adenosylcobinamide-phosphate synthase